LSNYVAKNWQNEPIGKADLYRMEQGIADAHTELQAHMDDMVAAHAASAIANTPSGNIAATDVQAAINELDSEKGSKNVANTWTARQTFGAGIQDGDSNQDVSFRQALGLAIDTRSWTATAWDATNSDLPTTIEVKDGLTLVATISITYNSAGKPTQMVVTAGGKTVTYAQAWNNLTQFAGRTKAVV
jgi:hypothetical protein